MKTSQKYIFLYLMSVLLVIIFSFFLLNKINDNYQEEIVTNNAFLIESLVDKYPSLEKEIILLLQTSNKKVSKDRLSKLGLDKESLIFLNSYNEGNLKIRNNVILIIVFSIGLPSLVFSFYLYDKNKKLKEITTYLNEILKNNYNLDIDNYDEGNISILKNEIYKVTVKLKEQNDISLKDKKMLQETLSDISHQLKTPITSMNIINDLLEKNLSKEKKKEFLNQNKMSLERIEWLVSALLKISMLDSGNIEFSIKENNINKLVTEAFIPINIPIELKSINIEIDIKDDLTSYFDFFWTKEAIINIIKNAYEHTKENGLIKVTASQNPIYTELIITDNGEGIKKEDLPHIFERFYKSNIKKESIGIGLNMAKKIFDMEKADISVISEVGKGTSFIIKFYNNIF